MIRGFIVLLGVIIAMHPNTQEDIVAGIVIAVIGCLSFFITVKYR